VPKIRGYSCDCGTQFEHMFMTADEVATCPSCGNPVTDDDELLGGHSCTTIVPMSRTSLKNKAGYVHTHGDRPAEKGSVSVTGTGEIK
jgi:hypothetical protein